MSRPDIPIPPLAYPPGTAARPPRGPGRPASVGPSSSLDVERDIGRPDLDPDLLAARLPDRLRAPPAGRSPRPGPRARGRAAGQPEHDPGRLQAAGRRGLRHEPPRRRHARRRPAAPAPRRGGAGRARRRDAPPRGAVRLHRRRGGLGHVRRRDRAEAARARTCTSSSPSAPTPTRPTTRSGSRPRSRTVEAEGALLEELTERLERFHYDLVATTTFHADEAQALVGGRVPVIAMIVGPGYMDLIHEIAALPSGSTVGLVCASARGAANIGETLAISGTTGVSVVTPSSRRRRGGDARGRPRGRPHPPVPRGASAAASMPGSRDPSGSANGSTSSTRPGSSCSAGRSSGPRPSGSPRPRWRRPDGPAVRDPAGGDRPPAPRPRAAPCGWPSRRRPATSPTAWPLPAPVDTAARPAIAGDVLAGESSPSASSTRSLRIVIARYLDDRRPGRLRARPRDGTGRRWARRPSATLAVPMRRPSPIPRPRRPEATGCASCCSPGSPTNPAIGPLQPLVDDTPLVLGAGRPLRGGRRRDPPLLRGRLRGSGRTGRTSSRCCEAPAPPSPGVARRRSSSSSATAGRPPRRGRRRLLERLLIGLGVIAEEAAEARPLGCRRAGPASAAAGARYRDRRRRRRGPPMRSPSGSAPTWPGCRSSSSCAKSTNVWLDQLSRSHGRADPDARPDPRRGARSAGRLRGDRALAHRPLGAQPGVPRDQAPARQPRRARLGLRPPRLRDRRRHRRRGRPRLPQGAGLAATGHPAGQRHGAQPHGHRLALGHRAPRLVPPGAGPPFPSYCVQRRRPVLRRAGRDRPRGPLLGRVGRGGRLQAGGPLDRARSATSTTATTARASPGTTRPSSTTSGPTSARRSSRRSSTSPGNSRSSASTPRWSSPSATSSGCGIRCRAPAGPSRRGPSTR